MTKAILSGKTLGLGVDLGLTIALSVHGTIIGHMMPGTTIGEAGAADLIATAHPGTEIYDVEALTENGRAFIALL